MQLNLLRQAKLLNFIYDSGWISYEFHADIHTLSKEIEKNLQEKFGRAFKIRDVIKLLEIEELKGRVDVQGKDKLAGKRRATVLRRKNNRNNGNRQRNDRPSPRKK